MGQGSDNDCLLVLLANRSDCSTPLYVVNVTDLRLTLLTTGGANHLAYWLPDNKHIMFESLRTGRQNAQIYLVAVDGTDEHPVPNLSVAPNLSYGPLWLAPNAR